MNSLYALIMAGGGGTRLWPESRSALPKQFIALFGRKSLIQIAFDRIAPLIPPERVLVVTGRRYVEAIQRQLPDLPAENIIAEPAGRNTAPAIGLGAVHLRHRDPDAVMAVLTADHIMHREETFRSALLAAARVAATGPILTLGITPDRPETGYGYIERGDPLLGSEQHEDVFHVKRFREKPDRDTAEGFVRSGRFFWNSGMFLWRVDVVLREIQEQLPDLYAALTEIEAALGTPEAEAVTSRVWPAISPISIDYGVMEGARDVAVLPVDPGWKDVGSWSAVFEEGRARDGGDNVVQGGEHLALDTEDCLIRSQKLVATIGLRDLVIIDTEDALLVAPRSQVQRVRSLVNLLKEAGREEYL
jgi:mannose-1-phosphate guanylyltransferase